MSLVDSFQKGKFQDFKRNAIDKLNEKRELVLSEVRKEIAKPLVVVKESAEESGQKDCFVYRTSSDGVVTVGDCFNMGRFKDSQSAEDALKQLKDSVKRNKTLYASGNYFYHILPWRDAERLSKEEEDEEKATEIDLGDREDDYSGDMGGDGGGMSEASNVYDQLVSIAKGKSDSLTFVDGDKSELTSSSAKKILKSLNTKKDLDKDKSINGLSKSYVSFMQTLNTIV